MNDQNKSILQKANAAMSAGDYEGFLAFCTDDTHWTFMGDIVVEGKEAVRQWIAKTYVEPPKFMVSQLIAENEFVTALGKITLKGEDGKLIYSWYCDVWRFQGGKMAELKAFVVENGDELDDSGSFGKSK